MVGFAFNYLNSEQIKNIKKYKYSSFDTSPISNYITRPFWSYIAKNFYPVWLSPNILTLLSILVLFLAYFVMEVYDVNFCSCTYESPSFLAIPGWVFVFTAISTFLAHTLDGSDGMQARNLGISSPLGELLDHGCDSMAAFLLVMFAISSLYICGPGGLGVGRLIVNLGSVLFLFYLSHWEKYITGSLFLPWAYDPTFILLIAYLSVLPVFQPISVFIPIYGELRLVELIEVLYQYSIWIFSVPVCLYNVYLSYSEGKGRPLLEAVRPFWAIFSLNILFYVLMMFMDPQIVQNHPKHVFWLYGLISSNIVCRLIVAQMCNSPSPLCTSVFIPIFGVVCWSVVETFGYISTTIDVRDQCFVLAVHLTGFMHLFYFASVIYQLTEVLDVPFFTVPNRKVA